MNSFIASFENNTATLTPDESWHCTKVLRNKIGDKIRVIDGNGSFAEAMIEFVSEKKVIAKIISNITVESHRPYKLHIAIAPTKNIDRMEWMIEKMVEIGVDEISFLECKNSERKVIKTERIKKIVESAVKQSLQAFVPFVNEMIMFNSFILNNSNSQKLIAHCHSQSPRISISNFDFKEKTTVILIGPEGDFTANEIWLAEKNGFKGIDLGHTRLRTETAGLFACTAVSILQK
jgi:16S rRNA (uracil1498-N3)-methyltransferase